MRIASARVTAFRLPLRAPLATAHGSLEHRDGWLLELVAEDGTRGFGEAAPLPGFGLESHAEAGRALEEGAFAVVGAALGDTPATLPEPRELPPSARSAVDLALLDLAARRAALPLAHWLARGLARADGHATARERVAVAALLASSNPEQAGQEARARVEEGFTTLKLKLAADDFERDHARVAAVRNAVGRGIRLRLDANGGWKEVDVPPRLRALAPLGIELIEQPVPAEEIDALARLRSAAPFPLAADESVRGEREAERLLAARAADVLVLKPAALGGLRPAARIAERARRAGRAVIVTSFLDSAVGVAGALHLAAALPEGPAAGLATAALLRADLAAGPTPSAGTLALPRLPGLGVEPRLAEGLARGATREIAP
ncbi:MAG: o-succinylbenzoate synthase [Myxococcota bacterium]|nr:o-succinylbenzoate synthase [Myxococcota bacterium]